MTTALDQYREMKRRDPDTLLIFRDGGSYVLFGRDAVEAGEAITLAGEDMADGFRNVIVGRFPAAALEANLAKLVGAGYRAAVLEQVQGPAPNGVPIERIVTEDTISQEKDCQ